MIKINKILFFCFALVVSVVKAENIDSVAAKKICFVLKGHEDYSLNLNSKESLLVKSILEGIEPLQDDVQLKRNVLEGKELLSEWDYLVNLLRPYLNQSCKHFFLTERELINDFILNGVRITNPFINQDRDLLIQARLKILLSHHQLMQSIFFNIREGVEEKSMALPYVEYSCVKNKVLRNKIENLFKKISAYQLLTYHQAFGTPRYGDIFKLSTEISRMALLREKENKRKLQMEIFSGVVLSGVLSGLPSSIAYLTSIGALTAKVGKVIQSGAALSAIYTGGQIGAKYAIDLLAAKAFAVENSYQSINEIHNYLMLNLDAPLEYQKIIYQLSEIDAKAVDDIFMIIEGFQNNQYSISKKEALKSCYLKHLL